ncbi:MAG TPA: hypothetical protein EYH06_03325 [Chromatiales bacterium]|nr:hypothetical protein [Thiotrichales bacterium]HIP67602.1 hypothetical protein [Chromatiales bacterium]
MTTTFATPKEIEVQEMLGMLYDAGLSVKSGDALATEAGSKSLIALYVDDEDQPVTVCACDYNFTAFAGAALTKIPKGGAEDAASSGDFSGAILGNLNEVMNICSRLFMNSSTPHLRLDKTYNSPDEIPEGAKQILSSSAGRADFDVTIPGYGDGKLAFIST